RVSQTLVSKWELAPKRAGAPFPRSDPDSEPRRLVHQPDEFASLSARIRAQRSFGESARAGELLATEARGAAEHERVLRDCDAEAEAVRGARDGGDPVQDGAREEEALRPARRLVPDLHGDELVPTRRGRRSTRRLILERIHRRRLFR